MTNRTRVEKFDDGDPTDLKDDARAQVVQDERLVRFGDAQFPGQAGVLDARPTAGARTAVVARNGDVLRFALSQPQTNKKLITKSRLVAGS